MAGRAEGQQILKPFLPESAVALVMNLPGRGLATHFAQPPGAPKHGKTLLLPFLAY
jgi:hypothetical protein